MKKHYSVYVENTGCGELWHIGDFPKQQTAAWIRNPQSFLSDFGFPGLSAFHIFNSRTRKMIFSATL